ncbi:MAG: hypothetical protein BWY79_01890 [Actinobacteria bacterium ADurb.Bin444]|nr:MAG: hypothetical protein BWY79_01890 [Actinobacteria bacterium ADurb.Bin444]
MGMAPVIAPDIGGGEGLAPLDQLIKGPFVLGLGHALGLEVIAVVGDGGAGRLAGVGHVVELALPGGLGDHAGVILAQVVVLGLHQGHQVPHDVVLGAPGDVAAVDAARPHDVTQGSGGHVGKDSRIISIQRGDGLKLELDPGVLAAPASDVGFPSLFPPAEPLVTLVGVDADGDVRLLGGFLLDDLFDDAGDFLFDLDRLFDDLLLRYHHRLFDDLFDLDDLGLAGRQQRARARDHRAPQQRSPTESSFRHQCSSFGH